MIKTIQINDTVAVSVETKALARVKLTMDILGAAGSSCSMRPLQALQLAQALLNAGHMAATVEVNAGAGGREVSPQRLFQEVNWPLSALIVLGLTSWGSFLLWFIWHIDMAGAI